MSQGTRSDQPLPQQPGEFNNDPAIQQLINERNSLRSQNDQLWKIVEKQRGIMQNLQKDLAKVTAERDMLRQANPQENPGNIPTPAQTPSSSSFSSDQAHGQAQEQPNSHAQANGYGHSQYQHSHNEQQQQPHSRRSPERRPYDADPNPEQLAANGEREPELASGFNPNSSFSSTTSSTDHRQHQHQQHRNHHPEHQSPRHHGLSHRPPALPLTPPSNSEGEYEGAKAEIGQDDCYDQYQHHSSQAAAEGDMGSRDPYDQEVQAATAGHRAQHYPERDPRAMEGYAPNTLPPRNISGSIAIAPHLMPHVPPRSPRRERKDDHNISPHASDNEDDYYPSHQGSRKNGSGAPTSSRARGEYSPEQPHSAQHTQEGREPHSRMPTKQTPAGELDAPQSGMLSGPIPTSPAPTKVTFLGLPNLSGRKPANLTPQALHPIDYGPTSPTGLNHTSTPTSPIHTIIDQDAEKFRMFMNKNAPNRKVAQGTNNAGFDGQDHAAALGQAVAMENIHSQIELQHQPHSGHSGHQVHPHEHWTGHNPNSDASANPEAHHHPQDSWMDQPSSQMPLPPEIRDRKRQSSLPIIEGGYPRIGARSTSHQRAAEDDDFSKEYPIPQPPRRYDSQPAVVNNPDSAPMRVNSPTPSGNSSVTNAPSQPSGHSRSGPTLHQQAFHMFGDNMESVSILVVGSGIKVNDKGRELLMFYVSVGREVMDSTGPSQHREEDEFWRVEKQYIDFGALDSKLRITQSRNVVNNLPKLPDKSLFSTNAPSKADARKVALEQYMQQLVSLRIKDTRDLCEFLRTGLVDRGSRKEGKEAGWKEGYLTKRGKNFGGWKTRFFVLRGPVLEYFDTKDGHNLGSIVLTYAQIGRQQAQDKQDGDNSNDPNSYRHAFLILEPKKGQTVADAKRNPSSVMRHVLCAETDEERDEWVEALLVHVGKEAAEAEPIEKEKEKEKEKERVGRRMPEIQKVSATPIKELASSKANEKLLLNQEAYERQQRSVPGSPSFMAQGRGGNVPQSPTLTSTNIEDRHSQERQSAEGQHPSGGRGNYNQYNDQDQQGSWGQQQSQQQQQYYNQQQQQSRNQSSQSQSQVQEEQAAPAPAPAPAPQLTPDQVAEKEKKQRSRMTFHWPKKSTKDESPIQLPQSTQQPTGKESAGNPPTSSSQSSGLRNLLGMGGSANNAPPQAPTGIAVQSSGSIRQVFGVSLDQAIEQAIIQPGYLLPAVVYRCIEYLNAHNAKMEEGIYRLNGSATIIKNLKDRFNHEGDVPLLSHDEYYDVHAIAGLLKLFLRELPSSVLTRELHKEFLQVIELTNRSDRVGELTRLVASLPEANYTILRALTAHLIEIVDNSDVNKMTARNVGIVFSPTLGISAGVFALLMSDFDQIFHTNDGRIMPLENNGMNRNIGDPNALLDA